MARLVISSNFILRTELFKKIIAKDTADGTASVIRAFMTENGIVLADDDTAVDDAILIHKDFDAFDKASEKKTKEFTNLFDPVWSDHTTMVQLLKKFYKNNIAKLGDWDVTVNGNRIVYPVDFINRRLTVLAFIAKHNTYAAGTSPLTSFLAEPDNKVDIAKNLTDATNAKTPFDDAKQLAEDAETKRVDRDNLMDPVTDHIEMIGNFLIGHYPNNPNKAGDWGFTVDTTPQKPKVRITNLKISEQKKLTDVAIGGTLKNLGTNPVHIYKGSSITGTPFIVAVGQTLGMVKGFSRILIVNPSSTEPGKISVLRHV